MEQIASSLIFFSATLLLVFYGENISIKKYLLGLIIVMLILIIILALGGYKVFVCN